GIAYRDFEPTGDTQGEQAIRNFASLGFNIDSNRILSRTRKLCYSQGRCSRERPIGFGFSLRNTRDVVTAPNRAIVSTIVSNSP
ncbi:hypothetical protein ACC702_39120, partial [Rhizobium ruizarguesonis]